MALWGRRRQPTDAPLSAVRAAAQRIEVDADKAQDLWFKRAEDWQVRAWQFYDGVGEAGYAANYMGNALARLRAFVGIKPDPQAEPEPLQKNVPEQGDHPHAGLYTPEEAMVGEEALDRLSSPLGGRNEIQRLLGVNFFVAGDCFLVGEIKDKVEAWDIYSSDQVRVDKDSHAPATGIDGERHDVPKITLTAPGSTQGRELPADAVAYRLWRPHPRFHQWADSPYRRALTILEELDIATRATVGVLRQRLQGPGVLLLPNRMLAAGGIEAPNLQQDGQAKRSKGFARDLIDVTSTAIEDPASAAAQVPFIVGVQDDIWKDFDASRHLIQWDRTPDEQTAKLRDELITRFAATVDLPAEIIKGMADTNHWSAWYIGDQAYQAHILPFATTAFDALTYAYLRPAMKAAGIEDVERFHLWFDPQDLVADPDQADKANVAHAAYLISDEVARRDQGYTEDDAPDADEIRRRLFIDAAKSGRQPPAIPVEGPTDGQGPPPEQEPTPGEPTAAIVASAKDRALDLLGVRLHTLDEGLLAEAHARADATMRRALERANGRLKSLALRRDRTGQAVRNLIQPMAPETLEVGPALGEALILTLADDETTDGLFAGAFDPYLVWWDDRVARTQDQALMNVAEAGDLSDSDLAAHVDAFGQDRTEGQALMRAAMIGAAGRLLLKPEPPTGPGELSGELVPRGLLRDPLGRAGGGGDKAVSLMTGSRWEQVFTDSLISVQGWTWAYGDPSARHQVFEPHRAMDGMFFSDPSSDHLGNSQMAWPGVSHWWPGDHPGCKCSVFASFRRVEPTSSFARPATTRAGV